MPALVVSNDACSRRSSVIASLIAALLVLVVAPTSVAQAQTAYVTVTIAGKVVPIDTATNTAGAPITVGADPVGVAIMPDGKTAYVANFATNTVTPIDTATNTAGAPIPVGPEPEGIAITPDGKTVYVTNRASNSVTPIDTATNTPGTPISLGVEDPFAITITPDGRTLYVGGEGSERLAVIDTTTNAVVQTIPLGADSASIAITPDGKTAYVVGLAGNVTPIDTATNAAGTPFAAGFTPFGIAISPDGATAYVVNEFANAVTPFLTATDSLLPPISVSGLPVDDALTPDGKTLYVTNTDDGSGGSTDAVTAFSTATGTEAAPPIAVGGLAFEVAITPAQAPTAAFSVQAGAPGASTTFNASASVDPHGSIAAYRWDFGDGSSETSSSPTAVHNYAAPGTYSARLTLTDAEGCSTALVFTGQTASCNGSAQASAVEPVTVIAPPSGALPALSPTAPLISSLRARSRCISHVRLAGAPSSGSGGLAFTYTLNEPASVLYVVKRRNGSPGRRSCGPAPGRVPGSYSELGGVVAPGVGGANGVSLGTAARTSPAHGRVGRTTDLHLARTGLLGGRHSVTLEQLARGKLLAPGTYVLLVRATNAAGQRSNDAMVKFFVTR
ncbi:MAG TPA: PKD domain-containing protein [Solirubrobacteraceae bacterium]